MPRWRALLSFANRRDQVRRLHEKLSKAGVHCGMLSGEVTQAKRTRTLEQFKSGQCKVLVATDVAGTRYPRRGDFSRGELQPPRGSRGLCASNRSHGSSGRYRRVD